MHPFETTIVELLEQGEEPTIAHFGGVSALLNEASVIGSSQLMPEFLRTVLGELQQISGSEKELLTEFVCKCVEGATDDFVLMEAVDCLDSYRPLPNDGDKRCFARFITIASDAAADPMSKSVALDGAFRWAVSERVRQLQLLSLLLEIPNDADPIFLSRAAKIMGVAYSYWRETELLKRLKELVQIEGVGDEAAFEIAMANLTDGLESETRERAVTAFDSARYWLGISTERREHNPAASAYAGCLDVLVAFSRGDRPDKLSDLASIIADAAFQIEAWHVDQADPPWLGARRVESACWNSLAFNLKDLSSSLDDASWWEPRVVVEQHVLASYVASRSVLRQSHSGGVETIVRPRIEAALTHHEGQAHALKTWLRYNATHEWAKEAQELSQRIDALIGEDEKLPPTEAAASRPSVAALLDEAPIPAATKLVAQAVIANAQYVHLANLSDAEFFIIEKCGAAVSTHPDYESNTNGRRLFDAVLFWTVRFLSLRLDMTKGNDPGGAYLFERPGEPLPREDELHTDYHRFMYCNLAGTEMEVSNIGGGRADVRFKCGGERLITEVKREETDSSFDALKNFYSAQTTDYQNVSIRLGFLLVLDLSVVRREGTPHILDLVQASQVIRQNETSPRWVIIVNIPGRRLPPSDLTKQQKTSARKR